MERQSNIYPNNGKLAVDGWSFCNCVGQFATYHGFYNACLCEKFYHFDWHWICVEYCYVFSIHIFYFSAWNRYSWVEWLRINVGNDFRFGGKWEQVAGSNKYQRERQRNSVRERLISFSGCASMMCVNTVDLLAKAAKMPIGYLTECEAVAQKRGEQWCFSVEDYQTIRRKYRGYAVSESDRFREGEIISGCCDRADQY